MLLVTTSPALRRAFVGTTTAVEHPLADAIADRLGGTTRSPPGYSRRAWRPRSKSASNGGCSQARDRAPLAGSSYRPARSPICCGARSHRSHPPSTPPRRGDRPGVSPSLGPYFRVTLDGSSDGKGNDVATEVTEQQAREVAEAARETEWTRPSFAKELYLGRFDLSLIHPHPAADRRRRRARRGVPRRAAGVLRDPRRRPDRARGPDPRRVHHGPRRPRRVRHEDPPRVRRPRACPCAYYGQALDAGQLGAPEHRRPALGAPVDRRARAGEDVRHRRAEAGVPAALRRGRDLGVPAHRARRRLRPGPAGGDGDADRRRVGVHPGRRQAVDHQRRRSPNCWS